MEYAETMRVSGESKGMEEWLFPELEVDEVEVGSIGT